MHATGHMDAHCVQSTLKIGVWSESESIEMGLSASRCIPRDERYKRSTITTIPRFIVLLAPKPHGKQTNNNRHIDVHVVIFIYICMQWDMACSLHCIVTCAMHSFCKQSGSTNHSTEPNERAGTTEMRCYTYIQIYTCAHLSALCVHGSCSLHIYYRAHPKPV